MCQIAFLLKDAESLLMAKTYRQSRRRGTSAMAPGSDVADSPCIRGVLTRRRPTGDQVDENQAYRTSVISVLPAWGETHYRTNLPGAAELAIIMSAGVNRGAV